MDQNVEQAEAQKNQPETNETSGEGQPEVPQMSAAEILELKRKADASSQNFERAKTAETELKKLKANAENAPLENISSKDAMLLAKSNIDFDDVDEVVNYARFRKIPISDALKDVTLKKIIEERKEVRQTALATQTKSPRGASKTSEDTLLEKAKQGAFPEKEEDITRLAQARMNQRLRSIK